MMTTKNLIPVCALFLFISSCGDGQIEEVETRILTPFTGDGGQLIAFPDSEIMAFFETETVDDKNVDAELTAPGKIVATVLRSDMGATQNVILFDNSELSADYTRLIHLRLNIEQIEKVNIRQKQLELDRLIELRSHGAATGREILNAETELSMEKTALNNERAAMIEHETKLRSAGFSAEALRDAKAGTAYLISDIPESQIANIEIGQSCKAVFTAFPNETVTGKIQAIADVVDNVTRMVKMRILIDNASEKLKSGMFANVTFSLSGGNILTVSENAVITVGGNHYVFVKTSPHEFERRNIRTGRQMADRIIVFEGLERGEEVAVKGVMQLKGLSFGY